MPHADLSVYARSMMGNAIAVLRCRTWISPLRLAFRSRDTRAPISTIWLVRPNRYCTLFDVCAQRLTCDHISPLNPSIMLCLTELTRALELPDLRR